MSKIFALVFATIIIWGNIVIENPAIEEPSLNQEISYYNHGIQPTHHQRQEGLRVALTTTKTNEESMKNGTNQKWVRFSFVIIIILGALVIATNILQLMQAPETQQEQTIPTASDENSYLPR